MDKSKSEGLGQERLGTSVGGGDDPVATSFGKTVTARAAPAFSMPMIWARVKEHLSHSGIFPPQAELTVCEAAGDAILIYCSWLLEDDPEQPDRRATPVTLVIHGDLVDLFHNGDPEILEWLHEGLVREVALRMKRYCADLGLPYHRPPPPFEIRVGLGLMGGVGHGKKWKEPEERSTV